MRLTVPDRLDTLPARLRRQLEKRGVALVLTVIIEALLILAVLSLGIAPDHKKDRPGARLTSFSVDSPRPDRPETPDKPKEKTKADLAVQKTRPDQPHPEQPLVTPPTPPVAPPPPAFIPLPKNQMAALDIRNLPRQPAAPGPKKALMGPVDTGTPGDSKRVGSAPNGQPLYAAAWYREPYDSELAGYLSTADGPGYALIACRTVPDWRVDDCVALDEYPSNSNIARAVLAAAWQFKVRPPRLGGAYKVGEWVRIRIDYTRSPGRGVSP